MAIKSPLLREWARPQGILLENEWCRLGEFLDLYADVLERYSENKEEPTAIEKTIARSIASDIWRYDRETNDAASLMSDVVGKRSFSEARRNAFKDADDRSRLRNLHVSSIRKTEELLYILSESAKDINYTETSNVIKLKKAK